MSSSSSPLKRSITIDSNQIDPKRTKLEDSSVNIDEFDFSSNSGLILPNTNSQISSPATLDMTLQLPISSQPQSNFSTPQQVSVELQLPTDINSGKLSRVASSTSQAPLQSAESKLQLPTTTATTAITAATTATSAPNTQNALIDNSNDKDELTKSKTPADPDKLSDALLSAGVDLKAEEALLTSTVNNLPSKPGSVTNDENLKKPIIMNTPFLDPRQLAAFMNKVVRNNGLKQTFEQESQILELVTSSCEEWLTDILSNSIIISRHRRRSIKNRKRSEISKALRDISIQQKNLEERRTEKKKDSGITNDDKDKEGSEETQHKATNATVAMMTGKKKKYSWMTGGSAGAANSRISSAGSGIGETGVRFREAREEPGIAVRDLLSSLEKKRIGVEKTIVKGYAKLKD